MLQVDDAGPQRPDWAMSSSLPPDDFLARPESALSYVSDFSDDSFYSGGRLSRPSDDGSCTSPESDIADPFQFPSCPAGKARAIFMDRPAAPLPPPQQQLTTRIHSKTRKNAPWTKAMSTHLWSTYLVYLQDPTVTPFRIGASSVPPEGVCHRVAREARRSWKGPRHVAPTVRRRSSRLSPALGDPSGRAASYDKSGSITPTGEPPRVYARWPHSGSATRTHLRALCKSKDTSSVQLHRHLQSRSPTPFSRSCFRSRPRTPEPPRLATFSTKEIALSLTTSTAESMQPDGPLALLASPRESADAPDQKSPFTALEDFSPLSFGRSHGLAINVEDANRSRGLLGSPFTARTYGPSSSRTMNRSSPPQVQYGTVAAAGPYLRSPLRFDKPRSLNLTQKRRASHALEEELSPNGAVIRPSILNEQLFGIPPKGTQRRVRSRGFSLGDETLGSLEPGLLQPSPIADETTDAVKDTLPASDVADPPMTTPMLLPSATFDPPRLGSPFSESGPSKTFPRRLFQDGTTTIRRSAFATMHQTRRSIESFDFGEGPSLQSRLSRLDQKLAEIRDREATANRRNLG